MYGPATIMLNVLCTGIEHGWAPPDRSFRACRLGIHARLGAPSRTCSTLRQLQHPSDRATVRSKTHVDVSNHFRENGTWSSKRFQWTLST